MRAEGLIADEVSTLQELAPRAYLRAALAVVRSPKRGEYAVVHFGSGTFFRTDWLGALTARALIDGRSAAEAIQLVDETEPGAGERAWRLIVGLGERGAMTLVPHFHDAMRWRTRRLIASAVGAVLSLLAPATGIAPISVLAWIYRILPSTPVGSHITSSSGPTIAASLRSSGYSERDDSWLLDISRRCAVEAARNWFFMYLSTVLTLGRLGRLSDKLFDRVSAESLAVSLVRIGPAIQVFLHSPLCIAVPNLLRTRGVEVVRVVVGEAHGVNVSGKVGALNYFGDAPEDTVDVTNPLASGPLLRHLRAGRSVAMALDRVAGERQAAAEVELVGHSFPRNDGPAWLAVRSGRPLVFWHTYSSPAGVIISARPPLHPNPSLPLDQRVADLSLQLYACAEAAIRDHPEAWSGWAYMARLGSPGIRDSVSVGVKATFRSGFPTTS